MRKTGFIAIAGLANAGKSTLLNALIEQKIAIVSPKPQTTRDNILGIWTDEDSQIVFVDTPGYLTSKNALGDFMLKSIDSATADVDCLLFVIDAHDGINDRAFSILERYGRKDIPIVVAITKTDISQPEKLMPELAKLNQYSFVKEVFCVSARKGRNIKLLRDALKKYLTGTEMHFDEDDVTDKSRAYLVAEIIREKVLLNCDEEIPHGVGVQLNKMQYTDNDEWEIDANVIVEKASHKPIVLGKHGAMIRKIGMDARRDIEKMLESHVYLTLWVKVKEDWRNRPSVLNELGYKI